MRNYFATDELCCPCCNVYMFSEKTLERLNNVRASVGIPMVINSGYRCEEYNTKKGYTQTHATGQAVDVACTHKQSFLILREAVRQGFSGIGVKQKGASRFIHLDDLEEELPSRPRPHVWSY